MQAILTRFLPATTFRGYRIKAECDRGSVVISHPQDVSGELAHIAAADALIAKFRAEDGDDQHTERNPWAAPRVCGQLRSGDYVHIFVK